MQPKKYYTSENTVDISWEEYQFRSHCKCGKGSGSFIDTSTREPASHFSFLWSWKNFKFPKSHYLHHHC